jgi:competence protein ComEA
MGRGGANPETVHVGAAMPTPTNPPLQSFRRIIMRKFNATALKTVFATLALSLALAGSALAGEKVNINSADAATLDRVLLNVGPSKAQAIVAYRKQNGPFRSAEQLAQVQGIGLKTVEKNRDAILIGGGAPVAKAAPKTTAAAAPKKR